MWKKLQDLGYNPVKLRCEFLERHALMDVHPRPILDEKIFRDEYELMRELLKNGEGVIFGEQHFDNVSVGFLIDNMEIFESLGVDTLFFEGLFYGLERGIDGERDEENSVHEEYSYLIECAKKHGMKVVGLDSKGCKRGDGVTRGIFMNAHAGEIINNTEKEKWIALTGMMHLESSRFIDSVTMQKHEVLGLADLTGATSIILHSIDHNEEKYIKRKEEFLAWPAKRITPDFIIGIYSNKRIEDVYRGKIITNPVEELYQMIKDFGWKISHYDIDIYAKHHPEHGYISGIVFALLNRVVPNELLLRIKQEIEDRFASIEGKRGYAWLTVDVNDNEIIFSCNIDSIDNAIICVKEPLLSVAFSN